MNRLKLICKPRKEGREYVLHCNNGESYSIKEMAIEIEISYDSMVYRLNNWPWNHKDFLRKKSLADFTEIDEFALDIVEGDLVGKFDGRDADEQKRALEAIPDLTEFERELWQIRGVY